MGWHPKRRAWRLGGTSTGPKPPADPLPTPPSPPAAPDLGGTVNCRGTVVALHDDNLLPRAGGNLHVCRYCSGTRVYPLAWTELPPNTLGQGVEGWRLILRCPDCDEQWRGEYEHAQVDAFDAFLNRATDGLIDDLEALTRVNLEADIEAFAAALAVDAILPEDFGRPT